MRTIRPLAATVGVFALLAVLASPAGAQVNDVYQGSAAGRALRLVVSVPPVVPTTELSAGTSSANAASDQTANARGTGFLVLLGSPMGASTAAVPPGTDAVDPPGANPPSTAPPRNCVLNQTVAIVSIPVACSSSKASRAGNLPLSASMGLVEDIGIALSPAAPIATIPTGISTSEVTTTATNITARATANGGTLTILPNIIGGPPVATVSLSPASATVVCDRATGRSTPSFTAAVVTVTALGVTTVLPPNPTQPFDIAGLVRITVSGGSAQGNRAEAAGVSISVGTNAAAPILRLDLSSVEATASCARVAAAPPPTTAPRDVGDVLPRTGGTPWAPMAAGAGVLALAVLVRRVAVRAR